MNEVEKSCSRLNYTQIYCDELNSAFVSQMELARRSCQILRYIYLDRRLTWRTHIFVKRKQLGMKFQQTFWILGRKSELSIENKLMIYRTIVKPIWTYGIPLWGTASNSNIEILQRYQNKVLRAIVNIPWYISNKVKHADLRYQQLEKKLRN